MLEAEREEAAVAMIKTVMAAAVMTAVEGTARTMTAVVVMETMAAMTVKAAAMLKTAAQW
jgi:hypothetical protein